MIIRYYWHNKTYGANEFVDYDTEKEMYWTGNTASTKRGAGNPAMTFLRADTLGAVKRWAKELEMRGVEFGGRE